MNPPTFDRWLAQILATEENELSCSDCFDSLSEYVERELAQSAPDARMRQLGQHLAQCRVCREEYEMLRELATTDPRDLPTP
jgi:uncharacterized protein with PIN domain